MYANTGRGRGRERGRGRGRGKRNEDSHKLRSALHPGNTQLSGNQNVSRPGEKVPTIKVIDDDEYFGSTNEPDNTKGSGNDLMATEQPGPGWTGYNTNASQAKNGYSYDDTKPNLSSTWDNQLIKSDIMPEKLPNHLLHGRILPWRQTYSSYAEALREGPRKLRENKENVGMGNFQSFGKKVDAGWSSFYGTLEPGNLPESKISIEAYSGTGKKNESNDKVEIDGWGTSKVYKIAPGHNTTKPGSFGSSEKSNGGVDILEQIDSGLAEGYVSSKDTSAMSVKTAEDETSGSASSIEAGRRTAISSTSVSDSGIARYTEAESAAKLCEIMDNLVPVELGDGWLDIPNIEETEKFRILNERRFHLWLGMGSESEEWQLPTAEELRVLEARSKPLMRIEPEPVKKFWADYDLVEDDI
ncbi:hypothetical protein ACHAPF_007295 [Botrytis cinerea]